MNDKLIAYTHTGLNYIIKITRLYKLIDYKLPPKQITPLDVLEFPKIKDSFFSRIISDADGFLLCEPNPIKGDYEVLAFYGTQKQNITHESFSVDFNIILTLSWAYYYTKNQKYSIKAKDFIACWMGVLGKPKDGGKTLLESLRARWEADTPIVTACQFPKLMFSCWLLGMTDETTKNWFKTYVDYVNSYYPSMHNNHRSFKALTLIVFGSVFKDQKYLNLGLSSYNKSIKFLLENGHMPLELIRGKKSASYTLMNLEAITCCEWWLKRQGYNVDDSLNKSLSNFKSFFEYSQPEWNGIKKDDLNKPSQKQEWTWIFVVNNIQDPSVPVLDWYGINTPRAFYLFYPQLY